MDQDRMIDRSSMKDNVHGKFNAPIRFPKIPPEIAVDKILAIKNEKLITRSPEIDCPPADVVLTLKNEKNKLRTTEEILEDKRKNALLKRKDMDNQWEQISKNELLFRDSFMRFSYFIKSNMEKRERAEKKYNDESASRANRTKQIADLKVKYDRHFIAKKNFEVKINSHRMYEQFLDSVLTISEDYKSIADIVNRYDSLDSVREELSFRQERDLAALESAKSNLQRTMESFTSEITGLTNILTGYYDKYDKIRRWKVEMEAVIKEMQLVILSYQAEKYNVIANINFLYKHLCARKDMEPNEKTKKYIEQLVYIKKALKELKVVVKAVKHNTPCGPCEAVLIEQRLMAKNRDKK